MRCSHEPKVVHGQLVHLSGHGVPARGLIVLGLGQLDPKVGQLVPHILNNASKAITNTAHPRYLARASSLRSDMRRPVFLDELLCELARMPITFLSESIEEGLIGNGGEYEGLL